MEDDRTELRPIHQDHTQLLRAKLLQARRDTGASYETLGNAIGVSFFTIMRWINNGIKNPRPGSLRLLEQFIEKYEKAKERGRVESFMKDFLGGKRG
jgi:hypothetical protein